MAYLRKEEENVELVFPMDTVWRAIPEALAKLGWEIENSDDASHSLRAKTKASIISFGSIMQVKVKPVNEKTTQIQVLAETPVTTITSIFNFRQTNQRIELFLLELMRQLKQTK